MANPSLLAGRLAGAALVPVLLAMAGTVAASEVRCVRGDDAVRRVVVDAEDPERQVPCEVVYWKDTEQPGVRNVLWNAETDAAFCQRKAEELVETLESGGWSCASGGEQPRSATRQAPPEEGAPQEAAPRPPESPAAPRVATGQPAAPAAEPRTGGEQATPAVKEALAPPRSEAAPTTDSPEKPPASTALDAIIQQNLVRLNDGVDGKFAAEIGDYGDLDGDGLEDGLVFFTYQSDRLGQARFIAAYLYDGENYTLAATKPLAGSDDSVQSAEVESIKDGVISLRLNVLEPGDASCCPSGSREEALVLRGGQLVEARAASDTEGRS